MSPQILEIESPARSATRAKPGRLHKPASTTTRAPRTHRPIRPRRVELVYGDAVEEFAGIAREITDRLDAWRLAAVPGESFDPVAAVAEVLEGDPRFTWEVSGAGAGRDSAPLTIWVGLRLGEEE